MYLAVRPALLFASLIPLGPGLRLGAWLGRAAFMVLRAERRKMLAHLRVAFSDQDESWRVDVARRMCANLGRSFFEVFHFEEILAGIDGKGKLAGYVVMEGEEYLANALAEGRGGLVVAGHCGTWELMGASAVRMGYPLKPVVRALFDARFDRLVTAHRVRFGYHPVRREGKGAAMEIVRVLRANEFVGLLMDQDAKVPSVFVPFFGRLANTPSGPATLAYRMKMDCISAFIHRRPEGGHVVVVGAPIRRPETGDREADVLKYTAMLTQRIEEHVRQHPDEWVWMHRRWKRRPELEAGD